MGFRRTCWRYLGEGVEVVWIDVSNDRCVVYVKVNVKVCRYLGIVAIDVKLWEKARPTTRRGSWIGMAVFAILGALLQYTYVLRYM